MDFWRVVLRLCGPVHAMEHQLSAVYDVTWTRACCAHSGVDALYFK